jgi:hypothetical protein
MAGLKQKKYPKRILGCSRKPWVSRTRRFLEPLLQNLHDLFIFLWNFVLCFAWGGPKSSPRGINQWPVVLSTIIKISASNWKYQGSDFEFFPSQYKSRFPTVILRIGGWIFGGGFLRHQIIDQTLGVQNPLIFDPP